MEKKQQQQQSKAKKETGLSLQNKKNEDLGEWYREILTKSEMIEYYPDVSGCYILRPWSFKIWKEVSNFLDRETAKLGVEQSYFPLFVSEAALAKEAEHLEDFAPEVAWVTHSGNTELENKIALRPTSETIMYPAFAKWIRSHRDLPLRLVQACNVVRWEFKNPSPFLRTREFLWQEGHTAFSNKEDADKEVLEALDMYARVYEELLAVPVIKGRKSQKEKFAGGDYTTTVEAFIPAASRSIQGATSHSLGQNFAKMFNITFSGEEGEGEGGDQENAGEGAAAAAAAGKESTTKEPKYVWQNSWGMTTRVIGVMVMVHSDDKGLVLPPRVAPLQVVIVYIYSVKDSKETVEALRARSQSIEKKLKEAGVKVQLDDRRDRSPGFKYAHWEQRGVCLRLELGPKDLEKNEIVVARRDDGSKVSMKYDEATIAPAIVALLETVQDDMLAKARRERDARITIAWTWEEFLAGLSAGNLVLAPWSCKTETEDWVKEETSPEKNKGAAPLAGKLPTASAKTLCIPFNQPPLPPGTQCFTGRGGDAVSWCLWGRSY